MKRIEKKIFLLCFSSKIVGPSHFGKLATLTFFTRVSLLSKRFLELEC